MMGRKKMMKEMAKEEDEEDEGDERDEEEVEVGWGVKKRAPLLVGRGAW